MTVAKPGPKPNALADPPMDGGGDDVVLQVRGNGGGGGNQQQTVRKIQIMRGWCWSVAKRKTDRNRFNRIRRHHRLRQQLEPLFGEFANADVVAVVRTMLEHPKAIKSRKVQTRKLIRNIERRKRLKRLKRLKRGKGGKRGKRGKRRKRQERRRW